MPETSLTPPPDVDRARWYHPQTPWYARQRAATAYARTQRPADVTYQTREPEKPRAHQCPACDGRFRTWQGVTAHHVKIHGSVLDLCEEGHDLTGPNARRVGGGCRTCGNARDRARRKQ